MFERFRGLFALAALGLAGCGSDALVQGGGATETGNGMRVRVLNAAGAPQAGVPVRLVRTDTWLSKVAASGAPELHFARTDAQGVVRLDSLANGGWAALAGDDLVAGWVALGLDTAQQELRLAAVGQLRNRIVGGEGVSSVCAVGTDWCARADSLGRYVLSLPPGRWPLVVRQDTGLATLGIQTTVSGKKFDTTVALHPGRVTLDDFSSGRSLSQLFPYAGIGAWYVSSWGADSIKITYDGRLSMNYAASDTSLSALAGLALRDRSGFRNVDFSRMDSLCFDARSDGRTVLYLVHYDSLGGWINSARTSLASLDTSWQRTCLTPAAFGDDWASTRALVNDLAFVTRAGSFLELRNVMLWGVPLQAFSR